MNRNASKTFTIPFGRVAHLFSEDDMVFFRMFDAPPPASARVRLLKCGDLMVKVVAKTSGTTRISSTIRVSLTP